MRSLSAQASAARERISATWPGWRAISASAAEWTPIDAGGRTPFRRSAISAGGEMEPDPDPAHAHALEDPRPRTGVSPLRARGGGAAPPHSRDALAVTTGAPR